jgi:small conductance mechanosensitive channel
MTENSFDWVGQIWQQAQIFFSSHITPYLYNILAALLIFLIGKWLAKRVARWIERMMERRMESTVARFVADILNVLLFVFVIIATLSQLGVRTTSLVAILGAASLAVGLSLKDSLANFAAGVLLISLRPFRVGDYVETNSVQGTVKEIKIFATTLISPDNKIVVVPNNSIINAAIVNHYAMPTRRIDMVLRVSYSADLSRVKADLLDIMARDKRILKTPEAVVTVSSLGDTGVDLNVRPWVNSGDYWDVRWNLTEQIKNHFSDIGLRIPAQPVDVFVSNPQQTMNNHSN